jgi:hypothetical protein
MNEQCQFYGSRMVERYGRRVKEYGRCQQTGEGFWHDEIGDAYCPRHAKIVQRKQRDEKPSGRGL